MPLTMSSSVSSGSSKQPDHSMHDSRQTLHDELGQVIEDGELNAVGKSALAADILASAV